MYDYISESDIAKVRSRHADVPQDALPFDVPNLTKKPRQGRGQTETSVEFGTCPSHVPSPGKMTGLVYSGNVLVFREHTKRVGKVTVRCPGSGMPVGGTT